eukprot:2835330-Pleurochrysis_carterae.AAC.1
MRVLPSFTWTSNFIAAALVLESDYVPKYDVLDWLSAAVFDNYTEQVNYSAAHNADSQGERLDMSHDQLGDAISAACRAAAHQP